jgi:hypothetical protein
MPPPTTRCPPPLTRCPPPLAPARFLRYAAHTKALGSLAAEFGWDKIALLGTSDSLFFATHELAEATLEGIAELESDVVSEDSTVDNSE